MHLLPIDRERVQHIDDIPPFDDSAEDNMAVVEVTNRTAPKHSRKLLGCDEELRSVAVGHVRESLGRRVSHRRCPRHAEESWFCVAELK